MARYGGYEIGITRFCEDWKASCGAMSKADKYALQVNRAVKIYTERYDGEKEGRKRFLEDWDAFERKGGKGIFPVNVAVQGKPVR